VIDSGNAVLMLSKWLDEESILLCQCSLRDCAFATAGIIKFVSEERCEIRSPKGEATLTFRLDAAGTAFEYVERRALTSKGLEIAEESAERGALLILLRPRFTPKDVRSSVAPERDSISLCDLLPSELGSKSDE